MRSSCPALGRASASFLSAESKTWMGRDKPGHDEETLPPFTFQPRLACNNCAVLWGNPCDADGGGRFRPVDARRLRGGSAAEGRAGVLSQHGPWRRKR